MISQHPTVLNNYCLKLGINGVNETRINCHSTYARMAKFYEQMILRGWWHQRFTRFSL